MVSDISRLGLDLKAVISLISILLTFCSIVFYGGKIVSEIDNLKTTVISSKLVERVSLLEEKIKNCNRCFVEKSITPNPITYDSDY